LSDMVEKGVLKILRSIGCHCRCFRLLLADPCRETLFSSRLALVMGHRTWGDSIRWHAFVRCKPKFSASLHKFVFVPANSGEFGAPLLIVASAVLGEFVKIPPQRARDQARCAVADRLAVAPHPRQHAPARRGAKRLAPALRPTQG